MPARPSSGSKKSNGKKTDSPSPPPPPSKKGKKNIPTEDLIDPYQEQIDALTNERDEIRSKLNIVCSKIIENINIDNYEYDVDLTKQQPSDMSLGNLLSMIDEICHYRTAVLNLYQETDDKENIPVQKKITQLYVEEPDLFRKRLTPNQRLTFVARERDLWKENAEFLQIMYATVVDQLEMGVFKKINPKTSEILKAHRLNLEDVCLIFSSPIIRSINHTQKQRIKTPEKEFNEVKDQHVIFDLNQEETNINNENTNSTVINEIKEPQINQSNKIKRTVSFADGVNIFHDNKEIYEQDESNERLSHLPLAKDILVDNMDSNLRMLIIKELSKDSYIQRPPSRRSSTYGTNADDTKSYQEQQQRPRKRQHEWVTLARLIGIDQSEIDHWLSQSLQYPAGRVISTWCNYAKPPPTVAKLHSLVSSNELNRIDLAHQIESMYNI